MLTRYKCCRCGKVYNREEDVHRLLFNLLPGMKFIVQGLYCCNQCDSDVSKDDTNFVNTGVKKDQYWATEVKILQQVHETPTTNKG